MLYEYRRYEAVPGKLPALHRRFAEVTVNVWQKHGIRVVGFWEAVFGASNELHYMLPWEDVAERDRKWEAFLNDPDWQSAQAKSEESGPLVAKIANSLWKPTHYSPMK